jgi:hypothetical protein
MFALDFLKENPAQRARLIETDWASLFTDPATPYSVKAELTGLAELTADTSDTTLYFYELYLKDQFTGSVKTISPSFGDSMTAHKRIWDYLYSITQLSPVIVDGVRDVYYSILDASKYDWYTYEQLSKEEWYDIVERVANFNKNINIVLFKVVTGVDPAYLRLGHNGLRLLLDNMSLNWLRGKTITLSMLSNTISLLKDCPVRNPDQRYNSLAEVQAEHDKQTAETVKKMLLEKPAVIHYTDVYEDLVKKHGFYNPKTKNDFILRGSTHNNCVATYYDRHIMNDIYGKVLRLIFTDTGTCELNIYFQHGLVVMVDVVQYKGRHNRDIDNHVELTQLRIALTGLTVEDIQVWVEP